MSGRPDEPDEATRILQAGDPIAPSGEVQAMQIARPAEADDERTTIVFHPPAAHAASDGEWEGDADDRTTILHAEAGDEPTTILVSPAPSASFPEEEADETLPGQAGPDVAAAEPSWPDPSGEADDTDYRGTLAHTQHAEADEPTTILASAAHQDDAQTTLWPQDPMPAAASGDVASDEHQVTWPLSETPASPEPASESLHPTAGDDPAPATGMAPPGTAWPEPAGEKATSILRIAEPAPGAADSTEILPAAGLAGLANDPAGADGQVSGRAWFDRRLRDFNHALLHTQTGQKRPPAERQALAAAARDMIQRVGLRDPEHKPDDWTDTVLQADQLLVNTYFVRALIARGGVGEIYRARHRDLKTEHAIKILLPRYALDPTVLNLMLEEARLLQRVRHEAVVGCQGLLRDTDGRPLLVMDYLRGRTLSARLREGKLPPADLIVLAARLASGLGALHAQGLVHQDISPDNIILVDDNCAAATIIDFGLARSLDAPENTHRNIDFAGKFSWCSPEQLSSRATQVDARSDLYSLGLVLAAAARGARLDMGHDLASARAARHSVPPLDGIQEPVATLLRHLLAPSTATRLRSAGEVPDWLRARQPGLMQRLFGR